MDLEDIIQIGVCGLVSYLSFKGGQKDAVERMQLERRDEELLELRRQIEELRNKQITSSEV